MPCPAADVDPLDILNRHLHYNFKNPALLMMASTFNPFDATTQAPVSHHYEKNNAQKPHVKPNFDLTYQDTVTT